MEIDFYGIGNKTSVTENTNPLSLDIYDISMFFRLNVTTTDDKKKKIACSCIVLKNGTEIYASTPIDVLKTICEIKDNNEMVEVLYGQK